MHIDDMHVTVQKRKNNFDKITAFSTLDNIEVRLQYWVESLCNQLLSEFSSIQTLHRYYKHIENVHVTFCRQKEEFLTKSQHF